MTTTTASFNKTEHRKASAFTPSKLAILTPYALVLWVIAYTTIHYRGPMGVFEGPRQIALYATTIPVTILLNRLHLWLTGLPKSEIVNAVAYTLAVATTIDGLCIGFYPQLYSTDPVLVQRGAAWIIWAGAIACFLAFRTLLSSQAKAG